MTPPSIFSILLLALLVAVVYEVAYWREDHPRGPLGRLQGLLVPARLRRDRS